MTWSFVRVILFFTLLPISYFIFVGTLQLINSVFLNNLGKPLIFSDSIDFVFSIILNAIIFLFVINFKKFSASQPLQVYSKLQYFLLGIAAFAIQSALVYVALGFGFACVLGGGTKCLEIIAVPLLFGILIPFLFSIFIHAKTKTLKTPILFILVVDLLFIPIVMALGFIENPTFLTKEERSKQQEEAGMI